MAAAVENDIEEFIRNQKAKLQQERQYLSHQTGGLQQQSPRKPDLDYNEIERKFQEQKRREFNDYVNRPKFKKAPTPPQSGMKFGEYEDFRKRVEQQRKEEYRSELEKQTLEQAMIRAQGDIPRIGTKPNISQEELNNISQEKQRRDLRDKMVEDKRIREFERMLHMSHHDDRLTDYMEQERNRIIEDYPLREQDILAMFQRQIEEKERRKQNEARERELEKKQLEFERKLDQNYLQDRNDLGFQGRNAARSEPPPPGRRGDQYDAPRQQSEYVPPRRGARSPPRQDYSPRQEEREGFTERLHKRYEDERRQDYQNHVQQKYDKNRAPAGKQRGGTLSLGQYEDEKKKLQQERQREYRELMDKRVYYHSMKRKDKNKLPSLRNDAKIRQHPLVVYREQVNELLKSLDEIEENEVPENVLREYIKKIKQKKNLIEENYRLQQQVLRMQHAWPKL
uniref:Centrosome and spindle pole-associated protein 1 n=1 Tax=Magallana gigas TaxID=29159 RepID=A0A8W8ISA3_MAGGI